MISRSKKNKMQMYIDVELPFWKDDILPLAFSYLHIDYLANIRLACKCFLEIVKDKVVCREEIPSGYFEVKTNYYPIFSNYLLSELLIFGSGSFLFDFLNNISRQENHLRSITISLDKNKNDLILAILQRFEKYNFHNLTSVEFNVMPDLNKANLRKSFTRNQNVLVKILKFILKRKRIQKITFVNLLEELSSDISWMGSKYFKLSENVIQLLLKLSCRKLRFCGCRIKNNDFLSKVKTKELVIANERHFNEKPYLMSCLHLFDKKCTNAKILTFQFCKWKLADKYCRVGQNTLTKPLLEKLLSVSRKQRKTVNVQRIILSEDCFKDIDNMKELGFGSESDVVLRKVYINGLENLVIMRSVLECELITFVGPLVYFGIDNTNYEKTFSIIEELLFVKQFSVIIYVEENEQLKRRIERYKNRLTYRKYASVKLATRG